MLYTITGEGHSMTRWTIVFDTFCQGPQPVMEDGEPISFPSEQAAWDEIESDPEFYQDCWPLPMDEIGRKAIYAGKDMTRVPADDGQPTEMQEWHDYDPDC